MLICPECGAENPPDAESCQRCNTLLGSGSSRLQWVLVGFLTVAVAGLAAWRLGVFDKKPEIATPLEPSLEATGDRIVPQNVKAESAETGVRLEFPGSNWKVNGKDSPEKIIKNPAAEFEFVDTNSFAFGLLMVEETQLSLDAYAELALNQVKGRYTTFDIEKTEAVRLGGEPAKYVEFQVVSSEKVVFKYMAWYVVRGRQGYQLVFYTIPSLIQDLKSDLTFVSEHFQFINKE